ncbi:apolipoprotein N-acyltransferase [Fundidesulfovibrio soli]|uniref:apolipoprotein N-acyltransferase n=1 Tax=Fundidesulfovibrio soli TaxID=2922716 RepID=UPI001FAF75DF|nr:apolipoprotein N-acyltransferase [Fundidesulfovibrio soli]
MRPISRPDAGWALVLLVAAAGFFAFANPWGRFPALVLLVPLGLVCLARQAPTPGKAAKSGWLAGSLGAAASLYWTAIPGHDFGSLPWVLAVPCPLLLGAVLGLYTALFCWMLRVARRGLGPLALGVLAGLAWTGIEALRGWMFSGFPWLPLAVAFSPWPAAIQAAGVVGAYGLSGLLAACGVWAAGPGAAPRVAACALAMAVFGYGLWALERPVSSTSAASAVLVQGNIDQAAKWNEELLPRAVQTYIDLTTPLLASPPDIVIWPETSLTFFVQDRSRESDMVRAFVRKAGVPLLAGAPGYERTSREADIFNRAYLFGPGGEESYYEKQHLVPFGEYAPFGRDVPVLSFLLQGVGAFTPGVRVGPLRSGRLAMGMLICYEVIFPELAQQRVEDGANILVSISNDAWFGLSAAPRQHLELATLRCVEQNRSMLRATNTGITALIDPKGRILSETALFTQTATAVSGVPLVSETSPYHRLHGWIEAGAALAALALFLRSAITTKRERDT